MLMLIATLMMMMIARWCTIHSLCLECQHLIIASRTAGRHSRLPGCDYFCSGPTRGTRRQSWPPSTSSSVPANEEANKILMKSWFFVLLMRAALYVFSGEFSWLLSHFLPPFWGESWAMTLANLVFWTPFSECCTGWAGSCLPSDRQGARDADGVLQATHSENIRISRFLV